VETTQGGSEDRCSIQLSYGRKKDGVASANPFEPRLYRWLRELVKLRDTFVADPATAKFLVA
jgi:hypothetical protein